MAFRQNVLRPLGLTAIGVGCWLGGASAAFAQQPTQVQKQGVNDEARQRYERGLKLFDDGAFDGARIEFERAYALSPTYRLLYNIGIVYAQLGDFVGAIKNLERYLREGGDLIPEARRSEVSKMLGDLRVRIAKLDIKVEPGADIYVDDTLVGKSPLNEPVSVNPGRRRVVAQKSGRLPATKLIDVASADRASMNLEMLAAPVTTLYREKPPRHVPWVGWGATAALAVGTGIFGYLSISESSKLKDAKASPTADPDDLDTRANRTKVFGYLADGLGLATIGVGALSLYYTLKWGKEDPAAQQARITIVPSLGGAEVVGRF